MPAPTFTTYAVGKILDLFFGNTTATPPATWYIALTSSGTELSGNGYARLAVTNNTTNFANTASRLKLLQTLAQFALFPFDILMNLLPFSLNRLTKI